MDTTAFMTKTKMIRRSDHNPSGAYVIAMDIGYSSVKVMSANIAAMFPSYAVPDSGMGIVGNVSDDCIRYKDLQTGAQYYVGRMAYDLLPDDDTDMSESSLYRRDRYSDPMFKVITETGLGLSLIYDDKNEHSTNRVVLETGLPPRYMTKGAYDINALIDVVSGRHLFELRIGSRPARTFDITIDPKYVHIMPQPMGTLFSVAVDGNHSMLPYAGAYFSKNVMIFDGGFGTLDLYPIKAHMIQQSETYGNLGMRRVLEETANIIRERFGKEISVPAMQKYLRSGTFRRFDPKTITTKNEPLDSILEKCSQQVCDEAIDKLMQVYPLYEYDYLIVTGGTGAAWLDQITSKLKGMETLSIVSGSQNDSLPGVFANVRGYYMYRYSDIRSTGIKK